MRARAVVIGFLALLAGCRVAPPPRAAPSGGFPSELAKPATSLSPSVPASSTATSPRGQASSPRPRASAIATGSQGPEVFTTKAVGTDPTGDQGADAPSYADLFELSIESDGSNARFTVTMRADVPNPMPTGEEMAIGVDLFRSSSEQESDYQLYATGNQDGWAAFLDTPNGFVRYPGTLQIGGARLVFTVAWTSVGNLSSGYTRAFMDWDRQGMVLNLAGEDHAPDKGKLRYR